MLSQTEANGSGTNFQQTASPILIRNSDCCARHTRLCRAAVLAGRAGASMMAGLRGCPLCCPPGCRGSAPSQVAVVQHLAVVAGVVKVNVLPPAGGYQAHASHHAAAAAAAKAAIAGAAHVPATHAWRAPVRQRIPPPLGARIPPLRSTTPLSCQPCILTGSSG